MNILLLTQRVPAAPDRGDRIRAYHLLKEMSRFARVSLFSFAHDAAEHALAAHVPFATRVEAVRVDRMWNAVRGAAMLGSRRPLTHCLLDATDATRRLAALAAAHPPDVIVAYCSGMARLAVDGPLAGRPLVLDMVDVDSAKWTDFARATAPPRNWIYAREASTLRAFEARAIRIAHATLVVNERERRTLLEIVPEGRVITVPNGLDSAALVPQAPPSLEPTVIFCGVMDYLPNVEAVRWFVKRSWSLVRQRVPEARFLIVGARPSRAVRDLAHRDPSVQVTGSVDAVQPYLWRSAVSVAPIMLARGVQNKVLEALAAGLPTVITEAVAQGLPAVALPGCEVRESAESFAEAVVTLLQMTPEERRRRAGAASLDTLSWSETLRPVESILHSAVRSHAA